MRCARHLRIPGLSIKINFPLLQGKCGPVVGVAILSDVAGQADILVAPDLEAGKMITKQLIYLAGADAAGVVVGTRVPIILTSQADSEGTCHRRPPGQWREHVCNEA